MSGVRVWIDQDLCTGDGLCFDLCPEVFVILEDGIAYVRDETGPLTDPGGFHSVAPVPPEREGDVVSAALVCPGECIFIEVDDHEATTDATVGYEPELAAVS